MNIDLDEFFKEELAHARAEKPIVHGVTKYCNLCQFVKPVSEFYLRKDKVYAPGYGYTSKCIECSKVKTREYWRRYRKAPVGICGICGYKDLLVKDHCHTSGMNRGMLCQNCNKALGLFKDSVASLEGAIRYLIKYSAGLE